MGRQIRVSTEHMNSDQEKIRELLDTTKNKIAELQDTMQTLSRCWEGPAWKAFQKQVGDDINYMKDVYTELGQYMDALGRVEEEYLKTERDSYSSIRSVWL